MRNYLNYTHVQKCGFKVYNTEIKTGLQLYTLANWSRFC